MQLSPVSPVQLWNSPNRPHQIAHHHQETPFTGRGRRQHRSCDQCRKGKRACDVTLVNYPVSNGDESASPTFRQTSTAEPGLGWTLNGYLENHEQSDPVLTSTGPCSNCAKTGKRCTLEWLKSVHGVILQRSKRSIAEATGSKRKNTTRKRQASTATSHTPGFSSNVQTSSNSDTAPIDLSSFLEYQILQPFPSSQFPPHPLSSNDGSDLTEYEKLGDYLFEASEPISTQSWAPNKEGCANIDFMPFQPTPARIQSTRDPAALPQGLSQAPIALLDQHRDQVGNEEELPPHTSGSWTTASLPSSYAPTRSRNSNRRTPSFSQAFDGYIEPPFDHIQQQLTLSANQTLMTNGLLRIYHDSMENALSCWLTEKTCPYGITIPSPASLKSSNPHESMSEEWGSNWSNRIFARVCHLDRASSVVRGRTLTQSEEKLASKALHLAIVSFATQWAQSSNRSTAKFSSFDAKDDVVIDDGAESTRGDGSSPPNTDFDRSIQESFWYQARRALQDSAEIESFRVIFAHIIFSLTQRPLNIAEHVRAIKGRRRRSSAKQFNDGPWPGLSPPCSESARSVHCSATARGASTFQTTPVVSKTSDSDIAGLDEVTELEGPPIFLETALRQIFTYRCKLESIERQRTIAKKKRASPETADNPDILSTKDRKTFDLLFWLAIMFDTLSAAMNKRPLVVSDEDSDIRDGNLPGHYISPDDIISSPSPTYRSMLAREGDSKLWGDFLLRQKHLRFCHKAARWPCSYEQAASTLCDAAPIKVLLFRKVTHLQTLLSRCAMYEKLEQPILDALQVYQHWNDSYNPFILSCIAAHDALPPRIQSWYVVLAGHWHLAALLLADIIELIDDGQMGLESQRAVRGSSRLVAKLREQNANVLADLGRCSCPGYNLSFPQAREFHFAVSEGALLTEPWTVVLIRAFSKAGYILLDRIAYSKLSGYERGEIPRESEIAQCQQRCSSCIRALWNLGKKSDMAFLAATALSTAVKDVTEEMAGRAWGAKHPSPDMEAIRQCSSSVPDEAGREAFPFVFSGVASYQ